MQVRVSISGIDFSQDVGPLVKAFYPGEDIEICYTGEEKIDNPQNELNILNISIIAGESGLDIKLNNVSLTQKSFVYMDVPDEHMVFEKRKRRAFRNFLLRELYSVLSKETGKKLPWGILTGVRPTKICFDRIKNNKPGNISYMVDEYLCSPKKAGMAQKVASREIEILKRLNYTEGYSLYVGFPFCPSICNYCSFGSHPIDKYKDLVQAYIDALLVEISRSSDLLKNKELQTIYFGGGTPTAVSVEQLQSVIIRIKECFEIKNVLEFCVEAGRPDSIDDEKLQMLKAEGVTRISINPQTMNEKTLQIIGRRHTAEQTVRAYRMARKYGFDNINMDLIAGLSGECFEDMSYTLDRVNELRPDSVTVHTLALKRAARLSTEKECFKGLEATGVDRMVEYAADFCMKNGYEPYYLYRQKNMTENLENTGYAIPGKEGLYNILIMEEVQMILALGAGASSKFTNFAADDGKRFGRVENVKNVSEYINRIDEMIDRKRNAFRGRRV